MLPRLKQLYLETLRPEMQETFAYDNAHAVPTLKKIVVNMGVGRAKENAKFLDVALGHLALIAGQRPAVCKARVSVAGFRLREGMSIGCKVTLRKDRMWYFLDKLIALAIPRFRDFRGLPRKAFDGHGNYSLGVSEQSIFPEIDADKLDPSDVQGMDVTLVFSGNSDEHSCWLLERLGFPFVRSAARQAS